MNNKEFVNRIEMTKRKGTESYASRLRLPLSFVKELELDENNREVSIRTCPETGMLEIAKVRKNSPRVATLMLKAKGKKGPHGHFVYTLSLSNDLVELLGVSYDDRTVRMSWEGRKVCVRKVTAGRLSPG